jgi:hypothetical protein
VGTGGVGIDVGVRVGISVGTVVSVSAIVGTMVGVGVVGVRTAAFVVVVAECATVDVEVEVERQPTRMVVASTTETANRATRITIVCHQIERNTETTRMSA